MIQRVDRAPQQMRREHAAVSVAALSRQAAVSRTFLYQNAEARALVTAAAAAHAKVTPGRDTQPAVEFVKDVLHLWTQLVRDLGLASAVAAAPAGIGDDDLEHRGERDPLESGDLRRDGGAIADGGSEGSGLPFGQLQQQPVNRR